MTTLTGPTGLTATAFDPRRAPPEQRLAVGRLLHDASLDASPGDPPPVPEREAVWLTQHGPDERSAHVVVWDGPRAAAWGRLGFDMEQNTHLAHVRLVVHPHDRRRGLGRQVWAALQEVAVQEGRRVVLGSTSSRVPAGEAFAQALGAGAAQTNRQSQLELGGVDGDLLARWQQRPDGDPYRLHVWAAAPDAYLDRMADLMMVMNTAPRGDLEMDDWTVTPEMVRAWDAMLAESGEERWLVAVEDTRSGQLEAYTELFRDPDRAALLFQGATGVRPMARGLGLGRWVKAAMLVHAVAAWPGARVVRTNNADSNAAMLGINVALGFVPWAAVTEWQLKLR